MVLRLPLPCLPWCHDDHRYTVYQVVTHHAFGVGSKGCSSSPYMAGISFHVISMHTSGFVLSCMLAGGLRLTSTVLCVHKDPVSMPCHATVVVNVVALGAACMRAYGHFVAIGMVICIIDNGCAASPACTMLYSCSTVAHNNPHTQTSMRSRVLYPVAIQ
jgi:hypothetical protein